MRYIFQAIGVVVISLGLKVANDPSKVVDMEIAGMDVGIARAQMFAIADYLRAYHKSTGRYPTTDEGLLVVHKLMKACGNRPSAPIGPLRRCKTNSSGILTLWGEPYIYENRNGLDPGKFSGSGASFDRKGMFAIRVDEGIYVWSIGARRAYGTYSTWKTRRVAAIVIFLIIALICLRQYVECMRRVVSRQKREGAVIFPLTMLKIAAREIFVLGIVLLATVPLASQRYSILSDIAYTNPRAMRPRSEYESLMAEYHDLGIINDAAYDRIINSMLTSERR
jgi:hypothetical protein